MARITYLNSFPAPTALDILERHGGHEIIEQVLDSLALWRPTALDAGLGRQWTKALEDEFLRFG